MKLYFFFLTVFVTVSVFAQTTYKDSLKLYLKNYVSHHEVVKGKDKKNIHFFDVDEKYRVIASFEKKNMS